MKKNYYQILSLSPDAPIEIVKSAYRTLCKKHHPDINNSSESLTRMQEINLAYEVLSNPITRAEYDLFLSEQTKDIDKQKEEVNISIAWNSLITSKPEIININNKLAKISTRLSNDFKRIVVLNNISYGIESLADTLKKEFLELHFGSNVELQKFALGYVYDNNTLASKEINQLITNNNSNLKANQIKKIIISKYGFSNQERLGWSPWLTEKEHLKNNSKKENNSKYEVYPEKINESSNKIKRVIFLSILIFALVIIFN